MDNNGKLKNTNAFCWLRNIEVRLYSKLNDKLKPIIFGNNTITKYEYIQSTNKTIERKLQIDQLDITIKCKKKLTGLDDEGTIDISNLTYSTIATIILGQYYKLEIWAGYKSQNNMQCFFKGEIAYISNEIKERRDYTCHIIFASELVARYSQQRINLNLNSSINLYAAIKYICLTKGIDDTGLNPNLKNYFLNEVITNWGTPANLLTMLSNNTSTFTLTADSTTGNVFDFTTYTDKRKIRINNNTIIFRKGNPRVTSDGLSISLLPTFNFIPGDIIIIDNSILDLSETSLRAMQNEFSPNYIDRSFANSETPNLGAYMIKEIDFTFQNRNDAFELNILARAISILTGATGT